MQTILICKGDVQTRGQKADEVIDGLSMSGIHKTDIFTVLLEETKKLIPIEKAREIIGFLSIKPGKGKFKVVLVKEAQNLSVPAQNALLKTLEEPPDYAQVILTVNHADNLLPTIVSRCKLIRLPELFNNARGSTFNDDLLTDLSVLLDMNLGQRVDWVTDNKDLFRNRKQTIVVMQLWESHLRQKLLKSLGVHKDMAEWANQIRTLQFIRSAIDANNANAMLGVEFFLLNLPV